MSYDPSFHPESDFTPLDCSGENEQLRALGRELDDAICDLRNCMSSPLLVELGGVYTRLVAIQMKFRAALTAGDRK